jgi:hypothetical protein
VLRARFENGRVDGVPSDFGGSPPPPTKLGALFDTLMKVALHCRGIMLDATELLFIKSGFETGDPTVDGGAINAAFRRDLYHTPFDEADQGFDFEAGADHARINFLTGYLVAQETERPHWNQGDFFGGLFGSSGG